MLFTTATPEEKRRTLKAALASGKLLRFPGAFSPLVAMLIEKQGFDGVYVSGAVLAADLGLPDVGLTTLSEVSERGHQIARVTRLPAIIDADTGFGEPMNVARTVRALEDLGLTGCHLEDQENPKRCGHLDHKTLVDKEAMLRKIGAAARARRDENFLIIARTDARAAEGLDGAIKRARAYREAGADLIFPEALTSEDEFARFREAVDAPLLANMTEFGKSPLLSVTELQNFGVSVVIYPVTSLRLAMKAVEDGLARLSDEGTQEALVPLMQTRAQLYALLSYEAYSAFDESVYDFGAALEEEPH